MAEEVNVRTPNGAVISGELIEYRDGVHAVVSLGKRTLQVPAAEIRSLIVGRSRPTKCELLATALLKEGGAVRGKLIEYVRYERVSISLGAGEPMAIEAADLKNVELSGGTGPDCVAPSPREAKPSAAKTSAKPEAPVPHVVKEVRVEQEKAQPLDPVVRAAAIQALMVERADWQSRETDSLGPLAFTLVGLAVVGATAALMAIETVRLKPAPAIALFGVGGASAATGVLLSTFRISKSQQEEEIHRIDQKLQTLGVQARVVPWVAPDGRRMRDVAGGLMLHLTM